MGSDAQPWHRPAHHPMGAVLDPFFALAAALRQAGFAVAPDQTEGFVAAVWALGPRGLSDVRAAALAMFAVAPERRDAFDAIFRAIFEGQAIAAEAESDDDGVEAVEPSAERIEVEVDAGQDPSGAEATGAERLAHRGIVEAREEVLAGFARAAPLRLPRRLSYRRGAAKRGDRIDLRRALKQAARHEGEVMTLPQTRRKTRQRRIVLLVDVSGSMKARSDANLRFAHALVHAGDRVEVFSLGTRLTRLTGALGPADQGAAMARVGESLADLDGGTRIGEALEAFLAVPRYAGFARGALVVVLSDGLERGDPGAMARATARLSRLAWRLHWMTPLAADPNYRPETVAMRAALPWLDALADGGSLAAICRHLLTQARAA